ncbi:MAG: DUF1493 family protein [Mixta sp.]
MKIEEEIISLIEKYDGHVFFSKRFLKIDPDTDLRKDVRLDSEDALDLIEEYAMKYNIAVSDIPFTKYFPNEKSLFDIFTPKHLKSTGEKVEPLTVRMLIESAKAGRWLYG